MYSELDSVLQTEASVKIGDALGHSVSSSAASSWEHEILVNLLFVLLHIDAQGSKMY